MSLAAVGSILQGCGGGGNPSSPSSNVPALSTVNGTVAGNTVTVTIDASSPLAAAGGAALVQSAAGSYLVSRSAQDTFTALTAVCTHQGCTITGFQNATYICPCHGSQFSTSGAVLQGPAPSSLRSFATSFASNVLTITTA